MIGEKYEQDMILKKPHEPSEVVCNGSAQQNVLKLILSQFFKVA